MGNIEGILVPMATAFNDDGSIDEAGTDALIDFNLACGVQGFFALGTHGQGMVMEIDGEVVKDLIPYVGYLHRGAEKLCENNDFRQGIGYMEDGTMVVVENGQKYLQQHVDLVVTSVLQTSAGRMIFGRAEESFAHNRGENRPPHYRRHQSDSRSQPRSS